MNEIHILYVIEFELSECQQSGTAGRILSFASIAVSENSYSLISVCGS